MSYTLSELAELLHGKIAGNPDYIIESPGKIEEAKKNQLTFIANDKYAGYLSESQAGAFLVPDNFDITQHIDKNYILVPDVYQSVSILLELFEQKKRKSGISHLSFLDQSASIDEDSWIGAYVIAQANVVVQKGCQIYPTVYLGKDVSIGEGTVIYPGVRIMDNCVIGNQCIIHSNSVIGSDGFGFAPQKDGSFAKIPQIGNVILEDYVEIGASCTIDRASMGSTLIKKGAKLDNLIQIAHNVEIGENTVIAAQTGIAGSTKIGKNCMIGGQVGIVGHLTIADGTQIQAKSGLSKSIKKEGSKLYGYPAIEYGNYLKSYAIFKNLQDLQAKVKMLESKIKETKDVDESKND